MKEVFEKLVQLGMIALCLVFCQTCTNDYIKGGDNKVISNYQKIISENTFTTATFSPIYKENIIKIAGLPIKTYDFEYFFEVDNQHYEGKETFSKLPKGSQAKVFYLKENPNFNTLNPQSDLKAEIDKNNATGNLYWGIFWGILSLIMLGGFIMNIREFINKRKLEDQNLSTDS
ncbi:hypothetical protein SAMN05444397_104323 [Flavobacterium aquidurense]|uniref:DUF3592 domain-containing protein n=1 Tax=Flavobacterium frigidimaris TaxID=262320 RepID=A0ABX4BM01_FLAFR|nr:hypothetical protein [Flavobacterium frigidimaris]OXA77054.1 hypothetical protein B0A65_17255 [Flavobacterium frigidimaris]SDZ24638.1 hypothetical protein SAMN05444397_104323 [Flavobacterium aquidurense]